MDKKQKVDLTRDPRAQERRPECKLDLHIPANANDATLFTIIGCFIILYGGMYFFERPILVKKPTTRMPSHLYLNNF